MAQVRFRHGLKANLPAVGVDKTYYYCDDSHELFIGTGTGMDQVGGTPLDIQVNGNPVSVQNVLNFKDGSGVTIAEDGLGGLDFSLDVDLSTYALSTDLSTAISAEVSRANLAYDAAGSATAALYSANGYTDSAVSVEASARAAADNTKLSALQVPVAGYTGPALVPEVEIDPNTVPACFTQDVNGTWHAAAGIDVTSSNISRPNGVFSWQQKFFFKDTLATAQTFKNALVSINHLQAAETDYTIQDRALAIESSNITATIANFRIDSNVVTLVIKDHSSAFGATCGFRKGQRVQSSGLSVGTYLNAVALTIQSVTSVVGGVQTITASDAGFTHADVGTTTDVGSLDQIAWSLTAAQLQMDLRGKPTSQGSPDGEWTCLSLQVSDLHSGTLNGPNQFGANVIRAHYYLGNSSINSSYNTSPPAVARFIFQSETTDGAGAIYRNLWLTALNYGVTNANMSYEALRVGFPGALGRYATGNTGIYVENFGTNAADYAIKVIGGKTYLGGDLQVVGALTSVGTWPPTTAKTVLIGPTSGGAADATFRTLVNTDLSGAVMTGDGGAGGVVGAVPAPATGDAAASKFLKADGTWQTPSVAASSVAWDNITAPAGSLVLSMAGNASTFNHTSAVGWLFANTVAATAAGVVSQSPIVKLGSRLFSAGVDTAAVWSIQAQLSPTTALSYTITNAAETAGNAVTLTIGTHTLVVGDWVTPSSISGTFAYLNTLNARITAIAATTITFTDPSAHGIQNSAATSGTITQIPDSKLSMSEAGGAGDAFVEVPAGILATAGAWGLGFAGATVGVGASANNLFLGTTSTLVYPTIRFYRGATLAAQATTEASASIDYFRLLSSVAGSQVHVGGNITTHTVPAVVLNNVSSFTGTAAADQFGVLIGAGTFGLMTFAPTSGSGRFTCTKVQYTVNQTGGASGIVNGLVINAVETAVGGTHTLLDLQAGASGGVSRFQVDNQGNETQLTANGAKWIAGQVSELLTLSTSGTTTDTSANLLPANSVIEAVVARVTTTITTATDWKLGDATTAGRFTTADATMTANETQVGLVHTDQTGAAGPKQAAAAKVRVTTTGTPGAGAIRITVFYRQFVAPAS